MRIDLHDGFHLSPVRNGDQMAYVEHLGDKELTDCLLRIPYPYTKADAEYWVRHCVDTEAKNSRPNHFAFRGADGFLIGGIGLQLGCGVYGHKAELGYWLIRTYRGRGLAIAGVRAIARFAFAELGLKRIEATTSVHNVSSQRVLEKAGFAREGLLAAYHRKEGNLIDVYMFSLIENVPASVS